MVKNAVDVIYGGLTYWVFGYGLSFGMDPGSNGFVGWGHFCVDSTDPVTMGSLLPSFVFQLSFATTATTIVSGAMAERTKLTAYIVFSFFNTVVYCIPAHWVCTLHLNIKGRLSIFAALKTGWFSRVLNKFIVAI